MSCLRCRNAMLAATFEVWIADDSANHMACMSCHSMRQLQCSVFKSGLR